MSQVYIYTRVSSKAQSKIDNVSLQMQFAKCIDYVGKHFPHRAMSSYEDICSARYMQNQTNLRAMIDRALQNPGSVIVVYNVSRFSRDSSSAINTLYLLAQNNNQVHSATESIVYPINRNSFRTKLVEANEESDVISERVTAATSYIKARGGHVGPTPYGYTTIRSPPEEGCRYQMRVLVEDAAEMSIIQRIIRSVDDPTIQASAEQFGVGVCNIIADNLNQNGIKRRKQDWTANSVKSLYQKFNTKEEEQEEQEDEQEEDEDDLACEICHETHSNTGNEMVLCDGCDKGVHIKCIGLTRVPAGDFFCGLVCKFKSHSV